MFSKKCWLSASGKTGCPTLSLWSLVGCSLWDDANFIQDWKRPEWTGVVANQGDDIAGTVHEVGEGTSGYGIKVGDRVAAFHECVFLY